MLDPYRLSLRGSLAGQRWTLALATLAVLIFAILGPVPASLILDRSIPWTAEPWRLLTAHLTHSDASHLMWDVAGLLLVGWLYEPLLGRRLGLLLIAGGLGICGAILVAQPAVPAYCGLSGIIDLIVGAGLIAAWRNPRDWPAILFACAVAAKILVENLTGDAIFTNTAWPPLHAAHAAGFMMGFMGKLPSRARIAVKQLA